MAESYTPVSDPDERVVEEVHCVECGVPISSIPSWYAGVRVKFMCETCRQKSPRLGQPSAASGAGDGDGTTREAGALGEVDPDLAIDDAELEDDTDLGLDEADEAGEE